MDPQYGVFIFHTLFPHVSHPYNKLGSAKAIYIFGVVCFWTGGGGKVKFLLIISITWRTFDIWTVITFLFWREIEQPG